MDSVHEVVEIEEDCPAGGTHTAAYTDTFQQGRRGVHWEVSCSRCGTTSAALLDELPPEAKMAMIRLHGQWELQLRADAQQRTILIVRDMLKLQLDDAKKQIRSGDFLVQGTHAEIVRYAAGLIQRGAQAVELVVRRV